MREREKTYATQVDAELHGAQTLDRDERVQDHRLLLGVHGQKTREHDLKVNPPEKTDGIAAREPLLEDVVVQETAVEGEQNMAKLDVIRARKRYVVDEGGHENGDGLGGGEVESLANQQGVVESRLRTHVAVVLLRAVLLDEREESAAMELVVVRVRRATRKHRVGRHWRRE